MNAWDAVNEAFRVLGTPEQPLDADSFIAKLEAQGWRITSAPESTSEGRCPGTQLGGTADDPVSAQAAPDLSILAPHVLVTVATAQAAVRAALEGLRAEVNVLSLSKVTETRQPWVVSRTDVIRAIDARLAALDG